MAKLYEQLILMYETAVRGGTLQPLEASLQATFLSRANSAGGK
jgi:hypothetical protein